MSAVPEGISRDEWLQTLPSALVAGFVKCDIDFQRRGIFVLISLIYTSLMDAGIYLPSMHQHQSVR